MPYAANIVSPGGWYAPNSFNNPGDPDSPINFPGFNENYQIPQLQQRTIVTYANMAARDADITPAPGDTWWAYTIAEQTFWLYTNGWKAIWTAGGYWNNASLGWVDSPSGATLQTNNGTSYHRYEIKGKTIRGKWQMSRGTSTNLGTGQYLFTLPVTPYSYHEHVGSARVLCNGKYLGGQVLFVAPNTSQVVIELNDPASSTTTMTRCGTYTGTTSTTTAVWNPGDSIQFSYEYETS